MLIYFNLTIYLKSRRSGKNITANILVSSFHRSSPERGWPRQCWCSWACLLSVGSPATSSTCTAATTTPRRTPPWPTTWPACVPASWPSPTPASTPSPSTYSARASRSSSTSSCAVAAHPVACWHRDHKAPAVTTRA